MRLLTAETHEDRGWTVVVVSGQLDVATAPELRQVLLEAQYGGSTRVLVDLAGIEFLDSMGLGVLVGALKRARTHDGELVLARARERVGHLLSLTGLDTLFRVVEDPESVLSARQ